MKPMNESEIKKQFWDILDHYGEHPDKDEAIKILVALFEQYANQARIEELSLGAIHAKNQWSHELLTNRIQKLRIELKALNSHSSKKGGGDERPN